MPEAWRHCSICKKDIPHGSTYYECSVSTCNSKRMALFFCAVECWSAHLPGMRHRDAWADEKRAPAHGDLVGEAYAARAPSRAAAPARGASPDARRIVTSAVPKSTSEEDVLVVVTKMKQYVKDRSGMNTSDGVMPVLSDLIRAACDRAIRRASEEGRKTVLERDFEVR